MDPKSKVTVQGAEERGPREEGARRMEGIKEGSVSFGCLLAIVNRCVCVCVRAVSLYHVCTCLCCPSVCVRARCLYLCMRCVCVCVCARARAVSIYA